ncbi:MAG: hypothetical protein FRX49_13782 [Trebouxia sp. A1-2]|nr:MAG: hypothetical protein FRX49_13782 [Trebouxia sp. A1-2]
MEYVSDSEPEDHLHQDLLYLKRSLGSAYRSVRVHCATATTVSEDLFSDNVQLVAQVASEVPETQHSKAPARSIRGY